MPRKLEWFEGRADSYVDTQLIPNTIFSYDISPMQARPPPKRGGGWEEACVGEGWGREFGRRWVGTRVACAHVGCRTVPSLCRHAPTRPLVVISVAAQVMVSEERESFAAFLTQICAIIGGVFTVTGLIDSFIFHGGNTLRKKMEIGKAA